MDRETMALQRTTCPGCGLELPIVSRPFDHKFNVSSECFGVFEQVLATEYQNGAQLGRVHRLTVDTYAVQHAGGRHPGKSVCVHFVGMYLELERGLPPQTVAPRMQQLAARREWPHLEPPSGRTTLTILDVANADSPSIHAQRVRAWAAEVWQLWSPYHGVARELARDLG